MGSPRKPRKKYETPEHPWRKERIESERVILKDYGLKNKREIYKMESKLRSFYRQARSLISRFDAQSKIEEKRFLERLHKYNLIDKSSKVEDALNLKLNNVLDRRLQTLVYKQGLAKSVKQARQFIVHGHIFVNDKKVNVPSYLVKKDEETKIYFDAFSTLANVEHPERIIKKVAEKKEDKKEKVGNKEKAKEKEKPKKAKKEVKKEDG